MRFDIVFYFLGIVCFFLATMVIPLWGVTLIPTSFVIVLLLFGIFCIASAYSTRPKKYSLIPRAKVNETKTEETKPLALKPAPTPSSNRQLPELTTSRRIGSAHAHSSPAKKAWKNRHTLYPLRSNTQYMQKTGILKKLETKEVAQHGKRLNADRKERFLAARKAALEAGWKPFTKMSNAQKAAWSKAFRGE